MKPSLKLACELGPHVVGLVKVKMHRSPFQIDVCVAALPQLDEKRGPQAHDDRVDEVERRRHLVVHFQQKHDVNGDAEERHDPQKLAEKRHKRKVQPELGPEVLFQRVEWRVPKRVPPLVPHRAVHERALLRFVMERKRREDMLLVLFDREIQPAPFRIVEREYLPRDIDALRRCEVRLAFQNQLVVDVARVAVRRVPQIPAAVVVLELDAELEVLCLGFHHILR
mmetsp:Transcript_10938/g.23383  ORF Transcript_10938/g.23383 Transcript_10938/m.23383 type:complete len:225 (+) Transcript_10938:1228-1902(+)